MLPSLPSVSLPLRYVTRLTGYDLNSTSGIRTRFDFSIRDGICVEEEATTGDSIIPADEIFRTKLLSTKRTYIVFKSFASGTFLFHSKITRMTLFEYSKSKHNASSAILMSCQDV